MLLALSPPPTLVESAYNHLKADIISSYLKPDEKINLKDLSQRDPHQAGIKPSDLRRIDHIGSPERHVGPPDLLRGSQ